MKTVFVLFTCDAWHTDDSKKVISVCDNLDFVQEIAKKHAKEEGEPLTKNDVLNLEFQKQTQGRELNFMFEETTLNSYFL
ncbi:hypothetical protein [Flavobacterium psychrophilum]|uniref:Uncharacterized protein n=1 Tax=Flavobacterium psychrophilum TaxID=96345 RepID=A0A7U2NE34_FLAPS|nr:hypothetical protein [Flavobacterium psychrophilum]QRE03490.1 hypothetical protein H0H26_11455 [Flavobacterium psychrophilum]